MQIFYAEPPKGAEHKELPKEAPKNLRPLLHPHMNIVYITILLEAVSETIPSRLDFLKSKLNNKGWTHSHPTAISVTAVACVVTLVAWSIRVGHGRSKNCAKSDEKCFIMVCRKYHIVHNL